jgi:uncharacterized protein YecE (DUF72 family)
MARLVIGTSGWAYSTWKPAFYPKEVPAKKFLSYYAGKLTGVEVNYTFRHFLTEKTQHNWIESTPDGFIFAVKAHQNITHIRRLKNVEQFLREFMGSLQPLSEAGKLGPVLFQLPPNLKCDAVLLDEFTKLLPRTMRCAFEFRHASWFADAVYDVLRATNRALCFAETEDGATPDVATADFQYLRLRLPTYTPAQLKERAEKLVLALKASSDVYAFFKHEETPEGALYALDVLGKLAASQARSAT